jgi:dynein heavy chain
MRLKYSFPLLPVFVSSRDRTNRELLLLTCTGVSLPVIDYGELSAALSSNAQSLNLQPLPTFMEKAIQLYEMIVVRHGLMLVGRSFSMKTVAIRVLAAALGDMCATGAPAAWVCALDAAMQPCLSM